MSKGRMHRLEALPEETIIAHLVNTARTKVELIEYRPSEKSRETTHHFLLRKIKFFSADNVKGYEIKIEDEGARMLMNALMRHFHITGYAASGSASADEHVDRGTSVDQHTDQGIAS